MSRLKRRTAGRPALGPGRGRQGVILAVRVTTEGMAKVTADARAAKLPRADYVRTMLGLRQ